MTITYTAEVATCRGFGCFLKLLLRWRGSIYKLVWLDLLFFLGAYYGLNLMYRLALDDQQKKTFEDVVKYCATYSNLIPLSFVLGFYVQIVMTRWWNQYTSIPWPDPIAVFVSSNMHGQDERGRVMRRTVMRYVCLCLTMALINISPRVKKRFPNLENLVDAGLLVENEKAIIESLNIKFPRHSKHWLPIVWAASIVTRARKEGRIRDDFAVKTILDELNKFRGQCGLLISYDTISVPLVYTQVVTLAVYSFFLTSVMAQQWVENKAITNGVTINIDLYFPIFTTLQFFFYMGWLKVAESLINPFGEDDDDFEVNWMVDRNLQVSYMIVDEMHHEHPELIKDQYWDEIFPNELPYSQATEKFREEHPEPSTAKIEVSKAAAMPTNLSSVKIDEMVGKTGQMQAVNYKFPETDTVEEVDDAASGIHFTAGNGKARQGSSPSLVSLSGTISRVNTVASALKRFLNRDETRPGSSTPTSEQGNYRFPGSVSSTSLVPQGGVVPKVPPSGSMRITDQVIEEVDEQMTITSNRGAESARPNVKDIFGSASQVQDHRSDPIDMPKYTRVQSTGDPSLFPPGGVDALLSSSAPSGRNQGFASQTVPCSPMGDSTKSLFHQSEKDNGSRETVEEYESKSNADPSEDDDFEKLRVAREKERLERQKIKLARSISTAPGITLDGEVSMEQMAASQAAISGPSVEQPTATEEEAAERASTAGVTPSQNL
ncbi:bestrophin-2 isoform X2 [Episyrphus balteatus]|uniref:bestrophin-2 isoform X2 n=1 Tax=Episyrphus balteatus TaxID=286459 RepID=UPI0024867617|nr:bestrophin-2 isoform X2 [Episyrphus balteatus]